MRTPHCFSRKITKRHLVSGAILFLGLALSQMRGFADEPKAIHWKDLHAMPVSPGDAPSHGPKDAKVTVVEFADYTCPFTIKMEPVVRKVMAANKDKVRFVVKHHWLLRHKNARLAAQVAMAAALQRRFWLVHEMLLDKHFAAGAEGATIDGYLPYLKNIPGLDLNKLQVDANSPEVNAALDAELKDVRGSTATPEFVINGHLFTGQLTEAQFQQLIDEASQ